MTVTIVYSTDNTDAATVSGLYTFALSNWNETKTVAVSAAQDEDGVDDTDMVIRTGSGSDYGTETVFDVTVTVDDETPGIALWPTDITVLPSRSNGYTLFLDSGPTVCVPLTGGGRLLCRLHGQPGPVDLPRERLGDAQDRNGDCQRGYHGRICRPDSHCHRRRVWLSDGVRCLRLHAWLLRRIDRPGGHHHHRTLEDWSGAYSVVLSAVPTWTRPQRSACSQAAA